MKIIKYIGGLGNQMFMYAFQLKLEKIYGEKLWADTLYYKNHMFHNGLELEYIFGINLCKASVWQVLQLSWYLPNYYLDYHLRKFFPKRKTTIYESPGGALNEDLLKCDLQNVLYFGFWQNHQYFDDIKDELIRIFKFQPILQKQNLKIYNEISKCDESVGIHIRRGDFLTNSKYKGLCGLQYYSDAIENINKIYKRPHFYIFSNDILWCRENIAPLLQADNVSYVDWNKGKDSYIDMQLMTVCKCLVIANSTFSWWAAYLNQRDPYIIAPQVWKNDIVAFNYNLDNWKVIDNRS